MQAATREATGTPAVSAQKPQEEKKGAVQANEADGSQSTAVATTRSDSEAFADMVMREFNGQVGALNITDYQRSLVTGYFIGIDRALKAAEKKRIDKNEANSDHKYDETLAYTWKNVDLPALALDVVHCARMGLDIMQDNHVSAIPYKDNRNKRYKITLMPGYNGIAYIAEKYALDTPTAVTCELVYSTDEFRPIKKDASNPVESYDFTIKQPFNRGEIIGGFGYIQYADPAKNTLVIMTRKDIEKRKPKYASAEFWGGKTKRWEKGKQVEEELDGWVEEMFLKTVKREVYSAKHIPRDPKKIDDNYQYMKMQETRIAEIEAQQEIDDNANKRIVDVETGEITGPVEEAAEEPEVKEKKRPF